MRTLYVSDLDGTLVGSDRKISKFSSSAINKLVQQGLFFSYATARSPITAQIVSKGLDAKIPLIVNNGAFIIDNITGEKLFENYFDDTVNTLIDHLLDQNIRPIVYAMIDGKEKLSYRPDLCTKGMRAFLDMRKGDPRINHITSPSEFKRGSIFNILCIDEPDKLIGFYEAYRDIHHCIYHRDIYTHEQWLEINPRDATKANAALQLTRMLDCDRLVAFGDGKNDMELFEAADECYAVSNADDGLKRIADGIILSNDEDAVAKWLIENAEL